MGEPSLRELEHDVEIARSKLARDLSTLRSPDTYSEFTSTLKSEATSAKDEMLEKAKTSVQSTVQSIVEDLKAKAAANPVAALAIGAGIAWRLIQHPPIATALVGAGLFSLLRTNAPRTYGRTNADYIEEAKERLRAQATDVAADIKERAQHALEVGSERVAEMTAAAKEQAAHALQAATGQVGDAYDAAKQRVQELGGQAASTVEGATSRVRQQTASLGRQASDRINELRHSAVQAQADASQRLNDFSTTVQNAAPDRDSFLVGAASVAVVAALGIACQRRLSEPAHTD